MATASRVDADELARKVLQLDDLERRCERRTEELKRMQVALMMERNLYLRKLREIEEYGRNCDWGQMSLLPIGSEPEERAQPLPGAALLNTVHDVLVRPTTIV